MYLLKYDDYPIYDPRNDAYRIRNTALHLGINEAGNFSFIVEKDHPHTSRLKKIAGILELQNDGVPIYRGRIIECSSDWNNSVTVSSEGILACLNDSVIEPFSFPLDFESDPDYEEAYLHGNVVEFFFRWVLSKHNSQVTSAQQLLPGRVTVCDPNNYISRTSESYGTAWSVLKTKLFGSSLGGYLLVRYESDGTYLDYYDELPEENPQEIVFGENLLDLTNDEKAVDFFSAVMPIGKDNLTIESEVDRPLSNDLVKSGKIIYSRNARAQYGNVTTLRLWEDVTEPDRLLAKAAALMLGSSAVFSRTITVSACDLHLTDSEICRFVVGRKTTITSKPHGISAVYPLAALDLDILKPGNAVIKLSIESGNGGLTQALGSMENIQSEQTDQLYTALEKYYTKEQINQLLTGKVGFDEFTNTMLEALSHASVAIGGSLTVGGIPIDGYARFS